MHTVKGKMMWNNDYPTKLYYKENQLSPHTQCKTQLMKQLSLHTHHKEQLSGAMVITSSVKKLRIKWNNDPYT